MPSYGFKKLSPSADPTTAKSGKQAGQLVAAKIAPIVPNLSRIFIFILALYLMSNIPNIIQE